jgi:ferrochelatase
VASSPLTELTFRQARGLEQRLRAGGLNLPVFVGMRNWRPYLADTLAEMTNAGSVE